LLPGTPEHEMPNANWDSDDLCSEPAFPAAARAGLMMCPGSLIAGNYFDPPG